MGHAMRRVGIMGGTFDPIHIGHLIAAEAAIECVGLDEVWFMPAHVPPHKSRQPEASAKQRLEMTELAVSGEPRFTASSWEMDRGGVSYTLHTVKALQEEYPNTEWYWIIGADMVAFLPQWHGIEELIERIHFIGVRRPGTPWPLEELPVEWRGRILEADMPKLDISSTNIRKRVKDRRSIRYFVPDSVLHYIQRWELYEQKS